MTPREERNHTLGYGILFFVLTCVFSILAYKLFSDDLLLFGTAMTVLTFLMAGTSVFCVRHFLISRYAEQRIREMKEKK